MKELKDVIMKTFTIECSYCNYRITASEKRTVLKIAKEDGWAVYGESGIVVCPYCKNTNNK